MTNSTLDRIAETVPSAELIRFTRVQISAGDLGFLYVEEVAENLFKIWREDEDGNETVGITLDGEQTLNLFTLQP